MTARGETVSYKSGTRKYYECLYRLEERCGGNEVIIMSVIFGGAFSPRLWIPEEKAKLTGQARKNYDKWPEWLSKNYRLILWQIPNFISMMKKELEETWLKSKHNREKVLKIFENRIKSIVCFLESIREEKSKAVILPSVLQLKILRGSCYTKTQSIHLFYRTFLEEKNFEGLYSYQPDGIQGLDLIMARHIFDYITEHYEIFKKGREKLDFMTVTPDNLDMVRAYDHSYRTIKDAIYRISDEYSGMEAFEKYEFRNLDWWIEEIQRERMGMAHARHPEEDISVLLSPDEEETKARKYRLYSHLNKRNPRKITGEDIEELLSLSPDEKKRLYDIFFNAETSELWVKGKYVEIASQNIPKTLLALFLKKVGSCCEFADIGETVWKNEFVSSNSIHQQKDIVCSLTDEVITPFIVKGKSVDGRTDVYYIRRETQDGQKLKYCLIIPEKH